MDNRLSPEAVKDHNITARDIVGALNRYASVGVLDTRYLPVAS